MRFLFRLSTLLAALAALLVLLTPISGGRAQEPAPTPTVDRLAAPPLPAEPSQADLGHQVYYQVCMACHGERGQGLTEEWREIWEEDSYCWASECHGERHPPQGFEFPQVTSPLVGTGTFLRFDNAQELHTYLVDTMPWWNPGYLKPEEYWQLTAFLLRMRGVLPEGVTLDTGNATVFHIHTAPPPGDKRPQVWLLAGVLAASAGLLALQGKFTK